MVALEAILASEKFVAAPQMSAFLRYVVEQAASGNKFRIKAYTVAVDALGKPDSFDPQNDPVVRVLAGRLRSSLTAYYETRPDEDAIIEMKPGSYVPIFILKEKGSATVKTEETEEFAEEDIDHSATAANSIMLDSDLPMDDHPEGDEQNQETPDAQSLPASQETESEQPASSALPDETSGSPAPPARRGLFRLASSFPKISIAAALLLAFLLGTYSDHFNAPDEPLIQAAVPTHPQSNDMLSSPRQRPDSLSLFVSAMEPTDSLVSQLSTMMSGVFSEAQDIRVYRLMRSTQRQQQYWPEDYLVSLNVLDLPEETQVSVQLVDAQTGRITHVENLHLSTSANQRLSSSELKTIMDCAYFLISSDGPLRSDYLTKISS